MTETAGTAEWTHCRGAVRDGDPDRFRSALFAGPRLDDLCALYAFNLEVARTAEVVSEPMLGEIRLQWWREVLDEITAGAPVRAHPVAGCLADMMRRQALPRAPFDALLDARAADLSEEGLRDTAAFEAYVAATGGGLAELALRTLVPGAGPGAIAAAREVGTGWAMIGLVRAYAFHAARGMALFPADMSAGQRGGEGAAAVRTALAQTAAAGRRRIATARAKPSTVPRRGVPALLHGRIGMWYADRIADVQGRPRPDYAVERPPAAPGWPMTLRLTWVAMRGRF